jgi:hypothetical protein
MTPAEIAADLRRSVHEGWNLCAGARADQTARRPAPGKWCAREILGHLIDSATNNHRRFVLAQIGTHAVEPYAQDEWVERQHYHDAEWHDLVTLWRAYNLHLAHVIEAMPEDALSTPVPPHTLGFIAEDYVRHLRHHLQQIRTLIAS